MLVLVFLCGIAAWLIGLPLCICGIAFAGYLALIYIPVVIYIPAFFKTLEYSLEPDAILLKKGVFWRRRTTVPFTKITNIDITQGPLERLYKISTLHLQTAGSSGSESGKAEIVIPGIRDCESLKDHIRQRVNAISGSPVSAPVPVSMREEDDVWKNILSELKGLREDLRKK